MQLGLIILIYLVCLGGLIAGRMALHGRPAYWLSAVGAALVLFVGILPRDILSDGVTFTIGGLGLALAVFGVALDLIFWPAPISDQAQSGEKDFPERVGTFE
jgi:hypothetical protein